MFHLLVALVRTPVVAGILGALTALPMVQALPGVGDPAPAPPGVPSVHDGSAAERTYRELAAVPLRAGGDELERAAVELADTLQAVPVSDDGGSCPPTSLTVSWTAPPDDAVHGAYIEPLGPRPDAGTDEVNGLVVCLDSSYAFMGFEASRTGDGGWSVAATPYLEDEDEDHGAEPDAAHDHPGEASDADREPAPRTPARRLEDLSGLDLGPIDAYAPYEPQRTCSPTTKPGTAAMRGLLLGRYSATRDLGTVRGCHIGGRSEHKEGRAFDWGAHVTRTDERRSVEDFLSRLLATDAAGNRHALARRMGVMYVIWDRQIWSAYRPDAGWRAYHGASPHTDHVHVSLSWDGAMGRTSLWRALAVDGSLGDLLLSSPGSDVPAEQPGAPTSGPRDEEPAAREEDAERVTGPKDRREPDPPREDGPDGDTGPKGRSEPDQPRGGPDPDTRGSEPDRSEPGTPAPGRASGSSQAAARDGDRAGGGRDAKDAKGGRDARGGKGGTGGKGR